MDTPDSGLRGFWPFYLAEHQHAGNRAMHAVGSLGAIAWLILAVVQQNGWLLLPAIGTGYGCAWIGHFGFERNRPATFRYPIRSFLSDWVLLWRLLTRKL